ncbi:MAG: transporter [Bacteroidetes bacterium]|nr:transporter [Bacteroidota bacterium]
MLTVSDLRKSFSHTTAVEGISFTVRRGEIFGLLGPNGAGKTTTIRMILDILRPDEGRISFEGKSFSPETRNRVGYLPEERGLYRKGKVLETILYFAELRGMSRGPARVEAQRWLARFGLLDAAGRRLEELSKGNQQKVQFIVAVIHDPDLIILDEPFSGLDPVNQMIFKDAVQELKRREKAIIFCTHMMDHAERLSDSLCLLDRGKIVLAGTVRGVKKAYGRNSLHIEFEGDGGFLDLLPGVQRIIRYENAAELELAPGARPGDLIATINDAVEIRKIELLEPSLHSIFIRLVSSGEPAALTAHGGPA